jgi:hypothetical protein
MSLLLLPQQLRLKMLHNQDAPRSPTCRTADKKGKRTDTDLVDKMESQGVRVLRNTGDLQEWKYDDKAGGRQFFSQILFYFRGFLIYIRQFALTLF